MICRACLRLIALAADGDSLSYIIGIWSFTSNYIVYWILLMIRKRPGKGMSIHPGWIWTL